MRRRPSGEEEDDEEEKRCEWWWRRRTASEVRRQVRQVVTVWYPKVRKASRPVDRARADQHSEVELQGGAESAERDKEKRLLLLLRTAACKPMLTATYPRVRRQVGR